ncbi:MAG: dihydroorotate dehydrogenase [Patescibacteria group bacterium]|jgi:dihydroorotate dehydrogenase|nr:dihydroorotate dehydrogenase [Patescibacteria group bacterium]
MLYTRVLKPLFFLFDPELVHEWMVFWGEMFGYSSLARAVLARVWGYRGPDISKVVDGVRYERPVLLSAGFDYNGRLTQVLSSIAFGGEEVGSVTALPCGGNVKPRLTRLPRNKSIVVFKGLRNRGVDALIRLLYLKKPVPGFVVGISIAQTNNSSITNEEEALQDYLTSFKALNEAGAGDYYTINISCPNAYGGETFATPRLLQKMIDGLQTIPTKKPVYFKMPINLKWPECNTLLQIIDKSPYQGVVIGNLNKKYEMLDYPEDAPKEFRGGLSGKPCFELSNELIRKTREAYGSRFTIIGVGGIFSGEDALAKFHAGADLVQLITGMIFEGPGLIKEICHTYAVEFAHSAAI